MKVYRKNYKISEFFPAERGDTWTVREGNFIAERWTVISARKGSMYVEIESFFDKGYPPRRIA